MSGAVINLIIQLIAGALGGIAIASELKNADLGTIGNSIVGAIGGMFLTSLIPCSPERPTPSISTRSS